MVAAAATHTSEAQSTPQGGEADGGGGALGPIMACLAEDAGKQWQQQLPLTPLSAAPMSTCDNLLLCSSDILRALGSFGTDSGARLLPSILSGFQLAATSGPLCEEPMSGVAFVLDRLALHLAGSDDAAETAEYGARACGGCDGDAGGETGGQLIVTMKEACRAAFLACSARVLEPVYLCELQTTQDSLGKAYGVLSRRRAQVIAEDMKEGTPIFTIQAHLPVAESFGFATDLRKNTSGAAHPQLVFSHYAALEQDPNFAVVTEEDQEALDDGDLDGINLARRLVESVRRRKGLRVAEKVVAVATKQRTLARKK